jgi:hypothetical protein
MSTVPPYGKRPQYCLRRAGSAAVSKICRPSASPLDRVSTPGTTYLKWKQIPVATPMIRSPVVEADYCLVA